MIYRKWGRSVRWENGTLVHVEEAGEAREENGVFVAEPIAHVIPSVSEGSRTRVTSIAAEILRCAQDDVAVERAIVIDGFAVHEYAGKRWEERTCRVHVALTRKPWRVLVDDAEHVAAVADALARCEGECELDHVLVPAHLAWNAGVFAGWLGGVSPPMRRDASSPAVETTALPVFEQLAGGVDGYGCPIEHRRVEGEPPNFYRPSYRVRPVRQWLNVRPIPFGVMRDAPKVLALVDGGKALVEHEQRVFVTQLRHDRVTAVGQRGELLL